MTVRNRHCLAFIFSLALGLLFATCARAAAVALDGVVERLKSGQSVELIVEYDASSIEQQAVRMRKTAGARLETPEILEFKRSQYGLLKQRVARELARGDVAHLRNYSHLPMAFKRFESLSALDAYLVHPGVKAVFENRAYHHVDAQSLALINQPPVAAVAETGAGSMIAVIDDGIDFTRTDFGSCSSPGVPAGCHVAVSLLFGSGATDNSHGTNVSAIALSVAPGAQIAMLNAFSGTSAFVSDIISAINWAIANRATYQIQAINMSLGDGSKNTSACSGPGNPFVTPVSDARNSGITVVTAAGNDAYTNAISNPACTPGVISVGAVYDANWGGLMWGNLCTDLTTAADKIACFSDSASFLTMLAPGALITAGGSTFGGTSQASPHVAGAVAVLRSAFPNETLAQTQARLVNSGVPITDPRNGLVKPRLNLLEAARPTNNAFANRTALSSAAGNITGTNLLATKESGEPIHAGNLGGSSVWWEWTAPAAGQVSLDTHGSSFDTLLAIYTGNSVTALTLIAANDNDGSTGKTSGLLFEAQAGIKYEIAIDGNNGAAGSLALNWLLNTLAKANLSVTISGPTTGIDGVTYAYTVTATNSGPQIATNVNVIVSLPAQAGIIAIPAACAANANTVTCAIGNLASGSSTLLTLQVLWSNANGAESISARIFSDLPDPVAADNTTSFQVLVRPNNPAIPTLPEWARIIFAGIVFLVLAWQRKRRYR